jgi:hypothetical protein
MNVSPLQHNEVRYRARAVPGFRLYVAACTRETKGVNGNRTSI